MSLKTLESSAFFWGKWLISVWKYGIRKLWTKILKRNRNRIFSYTSHRLLILLKILLSGTIIPKLPSLKATVASSTLAICHTFLFTLLHVQKGSFSESQSAQNLISDCFQLSVGTGCSLACITASARDSADASSQFCISTREHGKVHGPPICRGSVVHFGNNWFTQASSLTVGSKDNPRP